MSLVIPRRQGLEMLRRWRDKPVIKVVTGVRRCGKSWLLDQVRAELSASGVAPANLISLNLENPVDAEAIPDWRSMYEVVVDRLAADGMNYVFIDEVQVVNEFERAISGLHLLTNVDLYVTGSNATLLSGELATRLSGRYIEVALTPLSFAEFYAGRQVQNHGITPETAFGEFSDLGSFPFVPQLLPDDVAVNDYLEGILNTVLVKDVMIRQKVANVAALRDVVSFLMSNVGSQTSMRRVSNTLTSAGRGPSPTTVESYVKGLTDAFLLYPCLPYDVKGLRHLDVPPKYYSVDTGLRTTVLKRRGIDTGHVLENIVFMELRRRYRDLWTGRVPGGEIDFVAQDRDGLSYFQVAASVRDETTMARELAPLQAIKDHFPKVLLTLDQDPPAFFDGIQRRYVLDWLLEDR